MYPKFAMLVFMALFITACSQDLPTVPTGVLSPPPSGPTVNTELPPVGEEGSDGVVVKARALLNVQSKNESTVAKVLNFLFAQAVAAQQEIQVENSANTNMTLSSSQWLNPAISNAIVNFGNLSISTLSDNNLRVCGSNGHQKCTTALIRMYTTGQAGAGVYNSDDQWGAPITGGLTGLGASIGLGTSGAATLQSISIPNSKHTVVLADFSPAPIYGVVADFTNAGAGSYATTLVIEYGLSL